MRVNIFFISLIFLSLAMHLNAMPPHPDMVEQYKKEGQLKLLMNRIDAASVRMNMNSSLKSFTPNGEKKIPVLLVHYATSYAASTGLPSNTLNFKAKNFLHYGFFIIFLSVCLILIMRYSLGNKIIIKYITPAYLSCGVDKADVGYDVMTNPSFYSTLLNGRTSSDLSLKKYFRDMSGNNLNLTFDVYGPVKVSKPWNYYGENLSGNDGHSGELVSEALRLMVSKYSTIDFSIYDNDGNNDVDAVIIIHEGPGEESIGGSDAIWSHQWDLASAAASGDGNGPVNAGGGVIFNVYTIQPEYTAAKGDSSIGVFAHEFGHVLGLPDLYDTSGATNGVGDWSLMASGSWRGPGGSSDGTTPSPLLAWERLKIGGTGADRWITITTLAIASGQAIGNIETTKTAFRVMLDAAIGQEQYLLLEGKESSTSSQWYVPGPGPSGGILVSHIHEGVIAEFSATGDVNAGLGRVHGINIVEADGPAGPDHLWLMIDRGSVSDIYSAVGGVAVPSGYLNPIVYDDNINYDNSLFSPVLLDINIVSVSAAPWGMTFDVIP